MANKLSPLRNIPVHTVVNGVEITGTIKTVWPNDMIVVITSPVSGLGTCLHVPHFAMYPQNRLATFEGGRTVPVTARAVRRAQDLLREIYAHSQGQGTGWGVYEVGPDGELTEPDD